MALATTCPQCKTSFKVVPDQLKLRRGLVRCGVCQHVFSGIDYLRYVDDAARAAQRAARAAAGGVAASAQGSSHGPSGADAPWPVSRSPAAAPPASRDDGGRPPAPWAALAAPQSAEGPSGAGRAASAPHPGAPPDAPRADPWAAAAAAAHERSLRDDPPPPHPSRGTPNGPGRDGVAGRGERRRDGGGHGATAALPGGQPTLPWSGAAAGPQTVIGADDDLKTAFFLTDSSFGPFPGEQTDVMPPTSIHRPGSMIEPTTFIRGELPPPPALPAPGAFSTPAALTPSLAPSSAPPASSPPPAAASAPSPAAASTASSSAEPAPAATASRAARAPGAPPGMPLRPEAPAAHAADAHSPLGPFGPMGVPPHAIDADPTPRARATAPAASDDVPAIDYFSGSRRRDRGLGLALSPTAWVGALALSLLLAIQAVVGWRDAIAAGIPALAPALGAVLEPFGLEIAPPRDLSALTIESFELQATGAPNLLQLSAVLRNRSGHVVAFPAMELTLTDHAGSLMVRKVIPAETYLAGAQAPPRGLGARSEWPIRLALEHGGTPPSGYAVALFHP
jgi:predicted Zn finger-like uncharacterized protein